MKFSCERCGKKYATAAKPAPGKVYKLRCKACGHLIVVRAAASVAPPLPPPLEAVDSAVAPPVKEAQLQEALPEIPMVVEAPSASPTNGASAEGWQPAADVAPGMSAPSETAAAAAPDEEPRPPPHDPGYVDLFSDLGGSDAIGGEGKGDDPFLATARASLPEAYGAEGGAPDPMGPLRQDAASAARAPATKIPDIPRPPAAHRSHLPLVLIGVGVAVLVGILAFVLLGAATGMPAPRAASRPALAPPPPVPAPDQEPAPARAAADVPSAAAEQPPAEQAPPAPAEEDRRSREDRRRRDGDARAREARERAREAREERARRERELLAAAAASGGEDGLTPDGIEAVLRASRKAFESCMESARASGTKLDGRQVMLLLNIQPSGAVTYPTIDDVTLSGTELGSCLKGAARLMVFPRFKGDTRHVEVPLVLR